MGSKPEGEQLGNRQGVGIPASHPFAGFLRLLAEAIADKILEEQKGVSRVSKKLGTAPEPTNPASVQEKGKEEPSSCRGRPRRRPLDD